MANHLAYTLLYMFIVADKEMNIDKVKGTIEVDCRKCINLQNNGCIPYGNDADIAVKKCADDCFEAYVTYEELEKCEKESEG